MLTWPLAKAKPALCLTHLSVVKRSSQNLLGATPLSKYSCGLISNYISYGPVVRTVVRTVFGTGLKTMGEDFYAHAESDTEALGSGWTHQHPSAPAIVVLEEGGLGCDVSPSCGNGPDVTSTQFEVKRSSRRSPPMPTSAIKLSTGSEAIFCVWRSLPLLALSLFNIMLPALVGNPQRVVPVSLHAAIHNETKPGT